MSRAEAFNAFDWGSHAQARIARDRRAKLYRESGYHVFTRNQRALNRDYDSYEFVALDPKDNPIKPVHPDTPEERLPKP